MLLLLLLLLLWVGAVDSDPVRVDPPDGCNIIDNHGVTTYACTMTLENMETILNVTKMPDIESLSLHISGELKNIVLGANCFAQELKYLGISALFPYYIDSDAFNSSRKMFTLKIDYLPPLYFDLDTTTTIVKNVNWTSPTFGLGWLTPITGLTELKLSTSNFSSFRSEEFCVLKQLQSIDVSNNIIQSSEALGITCDSLNPLCLPCLPNVTKLDISNNPIKTLNINIADNLPQLRNLNISHSLLSHLDLGLLLSSNLERLELSNNRLQSLECQGLRNESRLMVLLLQHNQLQTLPAGLFTCVQQLQHLNVSTNLLTEDVLIQAGLGTLTKLSWLDLSHNEISSLPSTLIGNLTELIVFYCSGCRLVTISNETFGETRKLKVLKLDQNNLHVLESGSLSHLKTLQVLELSQNYLHDVTFIRNLQSLRELHLGHNHLLEIPEFSGLPWNLSTLILERNNISKVHPQHLSGLSFLKKLSLAFNHIKDVQDYAFKNLPDLNELVFNDNMIKTIGYYGLDKISKLTHLRLDNNLLTAFPPIKPTIIFFLHTVNLSKNHIDTFDYKERLFYLQLIDLSQNHISKMTVRINQFPNLRILDLRYNGIHVLDEKSFYDLKLSGIRPKVFLRGNPLHCDCHMEWLSETEWTVAQYLRNVSNIFRGNEKQFAQIPDLDQLLCNTSGGNGIKFVSTLTHDNFICPYTTDCNPVTCAQNCCRQHHCSCTTFCYRECTCYTTLDNSLNYMNCSSRHLAILPSEGSTLVKSLSLDGNNISALNSSGFNFPQLETLYINSSHVSHLEAHTFSNLHSLKILDLHQNQIENIRTDVFTNMGRLEELYLHENEVQFIESGSFSNLSGLKALWLHKNNMQYVNLSVFDEVDSLTDLTLHDNPWVCDCQFGQLFQQWLVSNAKVVSIPNEIYCRISFLPENTNTLYKPVLKIDFSICSNHTGRTHVEYRHSKSVVEGISLVTAFTVLVVFLLVLYINRLLLRVWMYNKYGLCFNPEDDDKEYDIFIAYSKADDLLVANEFLPALEEGQISYKVCIEGRDFPVGPPTADMVIAAIQKSKRTILFISHNYFNDQWCEYSFDAGLYQVLSDKQTRLLIILTDKDLQARMTPSMKLYMKMNPFLVVGEKWFWRKLCYYLPHNPQGADVVTGRQFNIMQVY